MWLTKIDAALWYRGTKKQNYEMKKCSMARAEKEYNWFKGDTQ
jgi:hypothetical protein